MELSVETLQLRFVGLDGNDFTRCVARDLTGYELLEIVRGQVAHKEGAVLSLVIQQRELCLEKSLVDQGLEDSSTISYVYQNIDLPLSSPLLKSFKAT